MRLGTLAAAVAALSLGGMQPGSGAALYEGPWCAHVSIGADDMAERCDMRSFAQCQEEIRGGGGGASFCGPNPRYRGAVEEPRRRKPQRERTR